MILDLLRIRNLKCREDISSKTGGRTHNRLDEVHSLIAARINSMHKGDNGLKKQTPDLFRICSRLFGIVFMILILCPCNGAYSSASENYTKTISFNSTQRINEVQDNQEDRNRFPSGINPEMNLDEINQCMELAGFDCIGVDYQGNGCIYDISNVDFYGVELDYIELYKWDSGICLSYGIDHHSPETNETYEKILSILCGLYGSDKVIDGDNVWFDGNTQIYLVNRDGIFAVQYVLPIA